MGFGRRTREYRTGLALPLSIFIADREPRRAATCVRLLRGAKGIRVVGQAKTSRVAISRVAAKPDILLFDLKLGKSGGVAPLLLIRARSPQTKVILLTGRVTDGQILTAISQGARGYLEPSRLRPFLIKAVRAVHAGETWVPRAMVAKIIDRLANLTAKQTSAKR